MRINTCTDCQTEQPIYSRGYCRPCFRKAEAEGSLVRYPKGGAPKKEKPFVACPGCGNSCQIYSKGLCKKCWFKQRQVIKSQDPEWRAKRTADMQRWRAANPDKYKENRDKRIEHYRAKETARRYSITDEEYQTLLAVHVDKVCDMCGKVAKRLVIEHCHETGRVRGMTCDSCNHLLGLVETGGPDILEKMSRSLSKHNTQG